MLGTSLSSVVQTAQRGVRTAILGACALGLRRRNSGAVVNGVVALAASFLPDVIERRFDVEFRGWQRVYAESAMLAHTAGMLGLYEDEDAWWWWDHLTHTLSATLLGGTVHAAARRSDRDPQPWTLGVIVGGGVLWEILEYAVHGITDRLGLDPVLIPYSARDTVVDLLFNLLGALLVIALGDRFLRNFVPDAD